MSSWSLIWSMLSLLTETLVEQSTVETSFVDYLKLTAYWRHLLFSLYWSSLYLAIIGIKFNQGSRNSLTEGIALAVFVEADVHRAAFLDLGEQANYLFLDLFLLFHSSLVLLLLFHLDGLLLDLLL